MQPSVENDHQYQNNKDMQHNFILGSPPPNTTKIKKEKIKTN